MNQAEQKARIIGAEARNEMNAKAIYDLQQEAMEQVKRIERMETAVLDLPERVRSQSGFHDRVGKLEEPARHVANMETARIQDIEFVKMLYSTVTTQGKRVGKPEAALAVLSTALE